MRKRAMLILLIIAMLAAACLTGCKTKGADSSPTPLVTPASTPQPVNSVMPAPTPSSSAGASPAASSSSSTGASPAAGDTLPPTQLDSIESDAEGIADDAAARDWTAAQEKVEDIQANFSDLRPILASAGVPAAAISSLGAAVDNLSTSVGMQKGYDASVQANAVCKCLPELYDHYKTVVPTDVIRVKYLMREITLNVENLDWSTAANNCSAASNLWGGLKEKLDSAYGDDIADFEDGLDALKAAIDKQDTAATTAQADALLDNLSSLKEDFLIQGTPQF